MIDIRVVLHRVLQRVLNRRTRVMFKLSTKSEAYRGPTSNFENMMTYDDIGDTGMYVLVGPSQICDGLSIYLSVDESMLMPFGTVICGYACGKEVCRYPRRRLGV